MDMKKFLIITGSVLFVMMLLGMMLFQEQGDRFAYAKETGADRGLQVGDIMNDASDLYLPFVLKNFNPDNPYGKPTIEIPTVTASTGEEVDMALTFNAYGHDIASMIFSVDFDETKLSFNPTPGSMVFNLPAGTSSTYSYDSGDTDGEIDIVILDPAVPLGVIPDSVIVTITFSVLPGASGDAFVFFSKDPNPSFGSVEGQSVSGYGTDGSILIK